jgi:hypothetical protein
MMKINAVKYDITKDWREEANEYGMSFMRGERINDGTERRGFKMKLNSKSAGKVGELAVCRFCEEHNIPHLIVKDQYERYVRRTSPYGYIFCIVLPEEVHIIGFITHLRFDRIKMLAGYGAVLRDGYTVKSPNNYYTYIDELKPITEIIDAGQSAFRIKRTGEKLELVNFM